MIRSSSVAIAAIAAIAMTGLAVAQPRPPAATPAGRSTLGADAMLVLPFGAYADGINAALGAFGRFEYKLTPRLLVSARAGVLLNIVDPGGERVTMFLLYGGLRYNVSPAASGGVFLFGEAGANHLRTTSLDRFEPVSEHETNASYNVGGGFQTGKLQLRASLFVTPYVLGDGVSMTGIMGSVGADFVAL